MGAPEAQAPILVAGQAVIIEPVRVGQLADFCRHLGPILEHIDPDNLNPVGMIKAIGEAGGHWIEAVCIGTGLTRETLDAETLDVLVQLTARVIEVNADFLVQEALPVFEAAVGGLAEMSSAASEAGSSAYSPEVLN